MSRSDVPRGTLAVADAERATLERELAESRAALEALRAEHDEEIAAWLSGREAALALYRRRLDAGHRTLAATEDRRRQVERELAAAAGARADGAQPDMERARLGAALAADARRAEALRQRLAALEALVARADTER